MSIQVIKQPFDVFGVNASIVRDCRISIKARLLYVVMKSYVGPEPCHFPTTETLVSIMGCNEQTFKRYRSELIEVGLVEVSERPRRNGKITGFMITLNGETNFDKP